MQVEAAAPVAPTPRRTSVTHAWITDSLLVELASEAQLRRLHPDRLTALILEKVLTNGLVETLLDNPRFK